MFWEFFCIIIIFILVHHNLNNNTFNNIVTTDKQILIDTFEKKYIPNTYINILIL